MSGCVNEKCKNDPLDSLRAVLVSIDGDFACCPECKAEYEKQRDAFYRDIALCPKKTERWLRNA